MKEVGRAFHECDRGKPLKRKGETTRGEHYWTNSTKLPQARNLEPGAASKLRPPISLAEPSKEWKPLR
jgi:hypothetical protein